VDLLANGQWPFYVRSIRQWLDFRLADIQQSSGQRYYGMVDWFKLAQPGGKLYAAGFTNGRKRRARRIFHERSSVLNFSTGQFWLPTETSLPASPIKSRLMLRAK